MPTRSMQSGHGSNGDHVASPGSGCGGQRQHRGSVSKKEFCYSRAETSTAGGTCAALGTF